MNNDNTLAPTQDSSTRCFTTRAPQTEPPLFQNGHLVLQPHDIGWIVSGVFAVIAVIISGWLISKHLVWYTNRNQQRYIVRLLFMVPIYSIISFASYIFWNHSVSLTLVRDSYESFVIYSFFYLLLEYLSPTSEAQKDVVRNAKFQKWLFPLGFVKYRPQDGLYFLQLMKWGILQYCIVRPGTTVVAVILDFIGLYCEDSWSFRWGHVYITVLVSLSVTVAMYCLLQFYSTLATELAPHRPLLKFISIKSVVFLTFWQASLLSVLATFGLIKDTPSMTSDAIQNGIATILETVEMAMFAVVHLKAFTYLVYVPRRATMDQKTPFWRSLGHVLDTREFWSELMQSSRSVGKTIRGIETDELARRRLHFAKVMGRERQTPLLEGDIEEGDEVYKDGDVIKRPYDEHSSTLDDLAGFITSTTQNADEYVSSGRNQEPTSHNVKATSGSHPQSKKSRDKTRDFGSRVRPLNEVRDATSLRTMRPTDLYNVPLERHIEQSLQEEPTPGMESVVLLRGSTHFLVNKTRTDSASIDHSPSRRMKGSERSRVPVPRKHQPQRIVLPHPLE